MAELKPCPFCGGEATLNEARNLVYCTECSAWTNCYYSERDAVASWNIRASGNDDDNKTCTITNTSPIDREWNLLCFDLTCCHQVLDFVKPRYCVRCGAKVVR